MSVIVIEFVSLDGAVQDPDGVEGTPQGGWAFRHGPEPVAGDKFRMGPVLDTGVLLLGRRTWERFAALWPNRSDEFSTKLNRMPKLVASRSLDGADTDAWSNSTLLDGELVDEVSRRKATQDIVVAGSLSVVRTLIERDLVDEYRLLVFPSVVGEGPRVFAGGRPADLDLVSVERSGAAVLLVYRRASVAEERK